MFLFIFQIYINFCTFPEKDHPHRLCISKLANPKRCGWISRGNMVKGSNSISTTAPLPNSLIFVKVIELEKVTRSHMKSLKNIR